MKIKEKNKKIITVCAIIGLVILSISGLLVTGIIKPMGFGDTCNVSFTTTPTGCIVVFVGQTKTSPAVFYVDSSTAGTYSYSVSKSGYTTATGTVSIVAHSNAKSVSVTLPISGVTTFSLIIQTIPYSCSVAVGGVTKNSGSTGAVFTLTAGTYSVTVSQSGYTSKTETVAVNGPTTRVITLTAEGQPPPPPPPPPPPSTYTLTVKTTPSNCFVTISGTTQVSGTSGAVFTLAAGTYSVTISKTGYTSQTVSYTISGNTIKTVTLTVAPPPEEEFTVGVSVVNQETYAAIDGAQIVFGSYSETTNAQGIATFYSIPSGTYPVIASKNGFETNSATVVVAADVTTTIYLIPTGGGEAPPPEEDQYTLIVEAYDDGTNLPISGVYVTINSEAFTTDSGGKATATVSAGLYTVSLTKTGYASQNMDITISDSDKVISFYLVKSTVTPVTPVSPAKKIPGFEAMTFIVAMGAAMTLIIWRRRKKE